MIIRFLELLIFVCSRFESVNHLSTATQGTEITIANLIGAVLNSKTEAVRLMRKGRVKLNGITAPFDRPIDVTDEISFGSFRFSVQSIMTKGARPEPSIPGPSRVG